MCVRVCVCMDHDRGSVLKYYYYRVFGVHRTLCAIVLFFPRPSYLRTSMHTLHKEVFAGEILRPKNINRAPHTVVAVYCTHARYVRWRTGCPGNWLVGKK